MLRWLQVRTSCVTRPAYEKNIVVAASAAGVVALARFTLRRRFQKERRLAEPAPPASMMSMMAMVPQDSPIIIVTALVLAVSAIFKVLKGCMRKLNQDCLNSNAAMFFMDPSQLNKVPLPCIHSEASKTLSVIFPAYNEASRMPAALDEALEYLRERRQRQGVAFSFEVIVVDDGSQDDTYAVAMEYVKRHGLDTIRALRLPVNKGKGAAVRAGMLAARGQLVMFADSDGATQFSDIDKLESKLHEIATSQQSTEGVAGAGCGVEHKHAMVVGSRKHLEATDAVAKRHWARNVLMHGFHFFVTLVAGDAIHDTQCGFKIFTRRSCRQLFQNMRLQRWSFDVELAYLARTFKIPTAEETVNWVEVPGSKIRIWSLLSMALELVLMKLAYTTGAWTPILEQSLP